MNWENVQLKEIANNHAVQADSLTYAYRRSNLIQEHEVKAGADDSDSGFLVISRQADDQLNDYMH
jgi:hypothetical protein